MKRQNILSVIVGIIIIASHQNLYAFENIRTHPALTEKAIDATIIDNYLKTQISGDKV